LRRSTVDREEPHRAVVLLLDRRGVGPHGEGATGVDEEVGVRVVVQRRPGDLGDLRGAGGGVEADVGDAVGDLVAATDLEARHPGLVGGERRTRGCGRRRALLLVGGGRGRRV
jgi:hypothetical protein